MELKSLKRHIQGIGPQVSKNLVISQEFYFSKQLKGKATFKWAQEGLKPLSIQLAQEDCPLEAQHLVCCTADAARLLHGCTRAFLRNAWHLSSPALPKAFKQRHLRTQPWLLCFPLNHSVTQEGWSARKALPSAGSTVHALLWLAGMCATKPFVLEWLKRLRVSLSQGCF